MLERHFHGRLEHAGRRIADDDVDAIEMFADLGEHFVDAVRHADAALHGVRTTAKRTQLRAKRLGFVVAVVIVHRDIGARRPELARDGAADAARGTGNQRDFSGERA